MKIMNENIQRVLDDNGVDKISYYYINSPLVNNAFTTCVFINSSKGRIEARGVSICSLADSFIREKGKQKAFGRAMRALTRKENSEKINACGRDDEFIKRSMKIKTQDDELRFRNDVAAELTRIDPLVQCSVSQCGSYKKYMYDVPLSYPIRLANSLYRYKSQYRPHPSCSEEQDLLKRVTIFTEAIITLTDEINSGL